jgi:pilus assembly protein Flp/PilA
MVQGKQLATVAQLTFEEYVMRDLQIRMSAAVHGWAVAIKARTEGATAAEYALLVALIAVAIITAVSFLGGSIKDVFNKTGNTLSSSTS